GPSERAPAWRPGAHRARRALLRAALRRGPAAQRDARRGAAADGDRRGRGRVVHADGRRQLRCARRRRQRRLGLPRARGAGRLRPSRPARARRLMAHSVFIDGAAGTTGLEIRDRLAGRDEFALVVLEGDKRKDPAARAEALNASDFAILCLPDDAAREAVALIEPGSQVRVIDASTAHRVAPGWVYGFAEVVGHTVVAAAMRVSILGCYSTGSSAMATLHVLAMV